MYTKTMIRIGVASLAATFMLLSAAPASADICIVPSGDPVCIPGVGSPPEPGPIPNPVHDTNRLVESAWATRVGDEEVVSP